MQTEAADDEVERRWRERQAFFVARDRESAPAAFLPGAQHLRRQIAAYESLDAAPLREFVRENPTVRAELERQREFAIDVVETLDQTRGRLAKQKIMSRETPRRAIAVMTNRAPIEDVDGAAHASTMARISGPRARIFGEALLTCGQSACSLFSQTQLSLEHDCGRMSSVSWIRVHHE
jgi:hypothetical protein